MRYLSKIIALSSVMLLSVSSVFAIDAPVNLQANNITETNLSLSWDTVDTAFGYHVYYSDTQGVEILTSQKQEYITEVPLLIDGLKTNTQYYFLVSAFNEEGEESIFSEETSFSTIGGVEPQADMNASKDFKLGGIEVLAQNQISLQFTAPLEDNEDTQREFKVVEKDDELNMFYIKESKIDTNDSTKILVTFEEVLPVSTEFTLTVIDILDVNGRNIESGIESFENFYLDESFLDVIVEDTTTHDIQGGEDVVIDGGTETTPENQGGEDIVIDGGTETIPGNQGGEDIVIDGGTETTPGNQGGEDVVIDGGTETTPGNQGGENSTIIDPVTGKIMEAGEVSTDLNSAGADAKTLPQTGSEHVFMFILALILGAMAFVFKFRKA